MVGIRGMISVITRAGMRVIRMRPRATFSRQYPPNGPYPPLDSPRIHEGTAGGALQLFIVEAARQWIGERRTVAFE
jgi:hypothetical protein